MIRRPKEKNQNDEDNDDDEDVFPRTPDTREARETLALKLEAARHEAIIQNMHRLRNLRLQRDAEEAAKENNKNECLT